MLRPGEQRQDRPVSLYLSHLGKSIAASSVRQILRLEGRVEFGRRLDLAMPPIRISTSSMVKLRSRSNCAIACADRSSTVAAPVWSKGQAGIGAGQRCCRCDQASVQWYGTGECVIEHGGKRVRNINKRFKSPAKQALFMQHPTGCAIRDRYALRRRVYFWRKWRNSWAVTTIKRRRSTMLGSGPIASRGSPTPSVRLDEVQ